MNDELTQEELMELQTGREEGKPYLRDVPIFVKARDVFFDVFWKAPDERGNSLYDLYTQMAKSDIREAIGFKDLIKSSFEAGFGAAIDFLDSYCDVNPKLKLELAVTLFEAMGLDKLTPEQKKELSELHPSMKEVITLHENNKTKLSGGDL